jgi:REP element-mobilizing transposase RayT
VFGHDRGQFAGWQRGECQILAKVRRSLIFNAAKFWKIHSLPLLSHLKQGRRFGKDYFDELQARTREIRASEWHESEQGLSPVAVYKKTMSQTKPRSGDLKRCRRYAAFYESTWTMSTQFSHMANASQMYAQIVFSPGGRQNLVLPYFEESLYQNITGIVKEREQQLIAIKGMPDHLHIFIGFKPTLKISDLVADIRVGATKFIKTNLFLPGTFAWQDGYGCFTYTTSVTYLNFTTKQPKYLDTSAKHTLPPLTEE